MDNMTKAEYLQFLSDKPRTGKLATVRADGRPHVVPIWYTMDGENLIFTAWHTSVKVKNILRDARVALCVDEEAPPFHFVMIEGTAEIIEREAPMVRHWATIIGGRYMGVDQAEAFGKRNGVEGEYVLKITPIKVVAVKNMTD